MSNKTIVLAADHAGFELKEEVKRSLLELNYEVKDFGAFKYESTDDYLILSILQRNLFQKIMIQ